MAIITVSREYGAGGHYFGRSLAEQRNLDFWDSSLIEEVSRRMDCSAEAVERWDERSESMIDRLLRALRSAQPEESAAIDMVPVLSAAPEPDRVARIVRQVILEAARRGNAVIVGRGGAFVLAGREQTLHVRLVADRDQRVEWVLARSDETREQVERRVDEADRDRARYIRHHFSADWRDPAHYDLVLNTGTLGFDHSAERVLPFLDLC